jgi:hypothetical protein
MTRRKCQFRWEKDSEEFCPEPSVDYIEDREGNRRWLCALHYDEQMRMDKMIDQLKEILYCAMEKKRK